MLKEEIVLTKPIHYQVNKDISDGQLRPLYESVGWISYTDQLEDLSLLLSGSHLVISAWADNELVGLIRTIGDGVSIEYVQDLLVHPTYQHQGIGTALLSRVKELSTQVRQFVLITDNSSDNQRTIEWYRQQGLVPVAEANIIALWRK